MTKKYIIKKLRELKPKYENDGLLIIGLFGSMAKNRNNCFSDIDIAYQIDYNIFSKKFKDGFSKILKIENIKDELEQIFKTKVDFISLNSNNSIFIDRITKEMIYV